MRTYVYSHLTQPTSSSSCQRKRFPPGRLFDALRPIRIFCILFDNGTSIRLRSLRGTYLRRIDLVFFCQDARVGTQVADRNCTGVFDRTRATAACCWRINLSIAFTRQRTLAAKNQRLPSTISPMSAWRIPQPNSHTFDAKKNKVVNEHTLQKPYKLVIHVQNTCLYMTEAEHHSKTRLIPPNTFEKAANAFAAEYVGPQI